jgi:mRNA interferase RelE/StbE
VSYQVEFTKVASKQFKKLPQDVKERINLKIQELAIEPRPNGVKKLEDEDNFYRIRAGNYRVIYQIFDDILLVSIVTVGHRSEVYQDKS